MHPSKMSFDLLTGRGRKAVPLEKKVLVSLFTLAHNDTYRLVADRFDLSESTVHGVVEEVSNALNKGMMRDYIVWPGTQRQTEISDFYESAYGISGVIGSIGMRYLNF